MTYIKLYIVKDAIYTYMSLRYTLLGFINYNPITGYDLKKHMDNSTQFFWHASLSQIYPALKKLEKDGLIKSKKIPQESTPDKKIYSITKKGKTELLTWLTKSITELPPQKNHDLLKSFFSGILNKETILEHLNQQLKLHTVQLDTYKQNTAVYVRKIIEQTGLTREGVMWELTRQFGEEYEQTYIRWLKHVIKTVEQKL